MANMLLDRPVTFRSRLESKIDRFFEKKYASIDQFFERYASDLVGEAADEKDFASAAKPFVKILKRGIMFFPGVLMLHFAGAYTTWFWLIEKEISIKPFNPFFLTFLAFGVFITICGFGDLKKPKHLLIPSSVLSIGVSAGLLTYLFTDSANFEFAGALLCSLLLPLAFIIPFLAKYLTDKNEEC